MNFATFERGQVAAFAYRQARRTGSLDCMKAICYVLRNRLKAGWGNGTWLSLIEAAEVCCGNDFDFASLPLDPQDRLLQMMVRDIDDIYLGNSDDATKTVVQEAVYYQFVDLPTREWFTESIVRHPAEHRRIAQVGPIAFFE